MEKKLAAAVVAIVIASGCSARLAVPDLTEVQASGTDVGLVLVSAGRVHPGRVNNYPFVQYRIHAINDDGSIVEPHAHYIQAEPFPAALTSPRGHVGEGRYVFVHTFELPQGRYVMLAEDRGVQPMGIHSPSLGFVWIPGSGGGGTGTMLAFTVEAGKLNYLGELLTVDHNLRDPRSIVVNDEFERDYGFAIEKAPVLEPLPVSRGIAVRYR